ncbi:GMC oxidoreductase-domain-containing protein [Hypoxylon rubiginosum]|uniref:GMC oxidoreductase-domain-containing protein n=1 Tax=Hypoxylon rubiginosum TaxID=110542 RepID=A0ACB9Z4P3_9PEZI|nr:GMC oxidoreductase-domain-containing protein [Hypoxylon rubiginosum]
MGLYAELPSDLEEVDIIIAGGGTAGCIVAARLADADPGLSILVVEGGPNNIGEPTIHYPALSISHLLPTSKFTLFYSGAQSNLLAGRAPIVPSGGVLGGGSSINLLQYSRGQRSDYDDWKTAGWSAEDILPYMKKLETYHGPDPRGLHGHDGPIHVSAGTFRSERFSTDLLNSLGKAGWPEVEDVNTMDTVNRSMRALRYVSPEGKRQDTATIYLHPRLLDGKHPHLHVVVESQVERILFDDHKKAVGVIYRPNPAFCPNPKPRTIKARRMVVLSCGSLGSPLVLERSGVGNTEIVKRSGVELVADLPGVGENYDDHHMMVYAYKSSLGPTETLDGVVAGRSNPRDMIMQNDPLLGWNGIDVQAKVRPSEAEVLSLGPQFQEAWDKEFKSHPEKPLMLMAATICFPGDPTGQPEGQYFGIANSSAYPFSRGHMHISGPGLDDAPDFDPGCFSDAGNIDIKMHLWMYKKQREIIRRMDVFRGEVASWHPRFPAGSKAACIETDTALGDVPEIEYSAEDDAAILQWLREHIDTTWHSMGTCRMAPREKSGVVDPSLSVHGVLGLKVADMSIAPSNVAANTNNTAMAIGEKAADIFINELGLTAK